MSGVSLIAANLVSKKIARDQAEFGRYGYFWVTVSAALNGLVYAPLMGLLLPYFPEKVSEMMLLAGLCTLLINQIMRKKRPVIERVCEKNATALFWLAIVDVVAAVNLMVSGLNLFNSFFLVLDCMSGAILLGLYMVSCQIRIR